MSQYPLKYQTSKDENGESTIHDVPFFKVGEAKGFNYDEAWCDKAIENANELESESDFRNSVFIGHTGPDNVNPEAKGFMSKLKRVGDTLYTNISGIAEENLDLFKKKLFPHRSAEVSPGGGFFSGLALTAERPHFKFPALDPQFTQFGEDLSTETVSVTVEEDRSVSGVEDLAGQLHSLTETVNKFIEGVNPMPKDPEVTTVSLEKFEELTNQFTELSNKVTAGATENEAVKAENVKLTEQLAALTESRLTDQLQVKFDAAARFTDSLKTGSHNSLKGFVVAPAVVEAMGLSHFCGMDTIIKFKENDEEKEITPYQAMVNFAEAVIDAAAKGELLVPLAEGAKHTQDNPVLPGGGDLNDIATRDAALKAKMVELFEGEDKYTEAKKSDSAKFFEVRGMAFKELGLENLGGS